MVILPWLIPKHNILNPIIAGQTEKFAIILHPNNSTPNGTRMNPPGLYIICI